MGTQIPNPTENLVNQEERRKQRRFTLSTSNKIFYLLLALLLIGLYVAVPVKTPESLGVLLGTLLSFFIYPWLIAWVVWWIRGKKAKGGVWTFNIVLILILVGHFGQAGRRGRKSLIVDEMQRAKEDIRADISSQNNPEKTNLIVKEYADSAKDRLDRLSQLSTGDESHFYTIMREYTADSQVAIQEWLKSYSAIQSPRIFNFSNLDDEDEFRHQQKILKDYVNQSLDYSDFYENLIPGLRKRLDVLDQSNELIRGMVLGAMKGVREERQQQEPIISPLLEAHVACGKGMIRILDFMITNREGWVYEGEEVQFLHDELLTDFSEQIELLGKNEAIIVELSQELTDAR